MLVEERQNKILELLKENPNITVKEIAKKLNFSEPTIRRDFTELHSRGLITKKYGGANLNTNPTDKEIPFNLRENEKSSSKLIMGKQVSKYIRDDMIIMLDGSTSAYHIVPYLAKYKNIVVVTSGAKTAVALAERNIHTFCTGGKMIIHSFSYIGKEAEDFVNKITADVLFFSCHGLSLNGEMTDVAYEESYLRRVMFQRCKKKILLCDSSKIGKEYFYSMGNISEIDDIICESKLPSNLEKLLNKNK